jgi:hypothetical protein
MKQALLITMLAFLAVLTATPVMATSFGNNITVYDKSSSGTGWYGSQEDNEVESGCVGAQIWDLEGFFLKGTKLTMVGGFDFQNGNLGYPLFTSGDIFIDFLTEGPDASNGSSNPTTPANKEVPNTFGYDYVMDLDFINRVYNVYAIDSKAIVKTVYYPQNQGSNPWLYVRGGQLLLNDVPFQYQTGLSDDVTGFQGGVHNALTVDLNFLPKGNEFIAHFTMGCGNDNLMGEGHIPNPEPGTLFLMGCGLIGIAGFGRKRFSK